MFDYGNHLLVFYLEEGERFKAFKIENDYDGNLSLLKLDSPDDDEFILFEKIRIFYAVKLTEGENSKEIGLDFLS